MMKKLLFIFLIFDSFNAISQANAIPSAANAFREKKWSEAVRLYKTQRLMYPNDVSNLYFIGLAEANQKNYQSAITYYDSIFQFSNSLSYRNQVKFQIARCYSALNEKEKSIYYLKEIARTGSRFSNGLNDSLFTSIKGDPEFKTVALLFEANSTPCLFDKRYQKFNHFIGIWDVYSGNNFETKVAVDTVTQTPGGCSVNESFKWLSSDYAGKSMIFFDPGAQKYRMCWVGTNGDIRNFEEIKSQENHIELLAVTVSNENELIHRKMTIDYDPVKETIHQLIENSSDLGKTWQPAFNALFRKVKK
jgi:tetratricopeptide (TPR) repeat protein